MSDFNLCLHNTYRKDIIYTGPIIVMPCSKCEGRKMLMIWSQLIKIELPAELYLSFLHRRKFLMRHQKKNTLRDLPIQLFF